MFGFGKVKEEENENKDFQKKVLETFAGRVVRKDLTKSLKDSNNVPIYVLEYLLGMNCATDDEMSIQEGIKNVKKILTENYVRPDEVEKVKMKVAEKLSYTVIDKIHVNINLDKGEVTADFSNMGLTKVPLSKSFAQKYEKLLVGGIWSIIKLGFAKSEDYADDGDDLDLYNTIKKRETKLQKELGADAMLNSGVLIIKEIKPIQIPNMDLQEIFEGRKKFTKDEWIDLVLMSVGYEPTTLEQRQKWALLTRILPLIESNYNLVELGPRSTGKSHIYKEVSPNSILVSGGQTSVANLFYNMNTKKIGLVGLWDCVAFDEVAGINIKEKDGVQIMKDYMNSGSFNRGRDLIAAEASMVFLGNINQSVDVLLKTSNLFAPFPEMMANDTAFFDRIHYYLPGWEVPKLSPKNFTDGYGFISDYISEFFRSMRKYNYSDAFDRYFKLGNNINQRDSMAIRKTVSAMVKLLYPNGEFTKEEIEEVLVFALEGRRRVKEQLKRIGGMEFYAINFSYIDNETFEEKFVGVPEQGSGKIIPDGELRPGTLYQINQNESGIIGTYRLETEIIAGSGKLKLTGLSTKAKETANTAFNYLKGNKNHISSSINIINNDYLLDIRDLQGIGPVSDVSLSALIALVSSALKVPVQSQLAVMGSISIGGTINKIENLANLLQVANEAGAVKVLIPSSAKSQIGDVPDDLFTKFQIIFYKDPEDAVFKALGVNQ